MNKRNTGIISIVIPVVLVNICDRLTLNPVFKKKKKNSTNGKLFYTAANTRKINAYE